MKTIQFFFLTALLPLTIFAQNPTSEEVLNKSIAYHDPEHKWNSFNSDFKVSMVSPNKSVRDSYISINLPQELFTLQYNKDSIQIAYKLFKENCNIEINNKTVTDKTIFETYKISCDRGNTMKNYYTYLYGLPMKLKDEGTLIKPNVTQKTLNNKTYYVIEVHYQKAVGSDIWFFYFDKTTYAMEVYQFFKSDASGQLIKDSGEYILLEDIEIINGIKMPKRRAWYYNKNNGYLGTDILSK